MFESKYIIELFKGEITDKGYEHIINSISFLIQKYKWPNLIAASSATVQNQKWASEDIIEFTHQYFEWVLIKDKLKFLNKIPESYLSYYFTKMFLSFVSEKIKEQQQRSALSFDKIKELIQSEINNENYTSLIISNKEYWFTKPFIPQKIKTVNEINNLASYLPKIPINYETKHYKPLVKMTINDVFNTIDSPLTIEFICRIVFKMFDQSIFIKNEISIKSEKTDTKEIKENPYHIKAINTILADISSQDAKIINEYLFRNPNNDPLSVLADKYKIPKSTVHYKIDKFKEKIVKTYNPPDEEDGVEFIKKLSDKLDEYSK